MSDVVQIVGLQRSGTRWLFMMMCNNYGQEVSRAGKHHLPNEHNFKDPAAVLVIRKRFDHWLGSVYRERANLPEQRPEIFPGGKLDVRAALDLWESFYATWYAQENVVQIEYERLLRNPEVYMGAVAERLGWGKQPGRTEWANGGPQQIPDWRREMYLE